MKLENKQESSVSLQRRVLSKAIWATPLITTIALPVHAQCSSPPCSVTTSPPQVPLVCPTELFTTNRIQGFIYSQDLVAGTNITETMVQDLEVTNIFTENLVIDITATEVGAGGGTSTITPSVTGFTLTPGESRTVVLTNTLVEAALCFRPPGGGTGAGVRQLIHSVFVAGQSASCQQMATLPSGVAYRGRCSSS